MLKTSMVLTVAVVFLAGCGGGGSMVDVALFTEVTLDPPSASSFVGDTRTYNVNAENQPLTGGTLFSSTHYVAVLLSVTSSAPGVATVAPSQITTSGNSFDVNVTVACVSAGSATITAKTASANDHAGTANITCVAQPVNTSLVVGTYPKAPPTPPNAPQVSLESGQSTTIGVTATLNGNPVAVFAPMASDAMTLQFTSDNSSVATVSAQGTVTGVATGTANITVTASANGATGTAIVKVQVSAATTPKVAIQPNPTNLTIGGTQQLTITANGSPATTNVWLVADPNVARVSASTGIATGVSAGSTVVQSSVSVNGFSGSAAAVINVTGAAQACAATGAYTFATSVAFDQYFSNDYAVNLQMSLPLTFTISGTSVTVSGPAPFIGGTGTIDATCKINITATGIVNGIPNVAVQLTGALPAAGSMKLVYGMGTNGSLPRNYPVYYSLVK
jgi:uncharacterized protein YjdB